MASHPEKKKQKKSLSSLVCLKYLGSTLVIAVSVGIAFLQYLGRKPPGIVIHLEDAKPIFDPITLTSDQIRDYERDGTILIKNLLTPQQVTRVKDAIAQAPESFMFPFKSNYDKVRFDVWRNDETIANLALKDFPKIAAQILTDEPSFRLLRDAYFSYASGGKGCGWHVDDEGFWPTQNDTAGVTFWLALDDMTGGGGLALANQTFLGPETVAKCRDAIRGKTCAMETQSPECHELMENAKIDWDIKAGDAILWNRWVFHRTVAVNTNGEQAFQKKRYSIRYIPSNAKPNGAIHKSVKQGGTFVGSPYYPQVWPVLVEAETKALEHGLDADITPFAILKFMSRMILLKAWNALK